MNKKYFKYFVFIILVVTAILLPTLGYCDFDSSLDAIQGKLTRKILPTVGIIGLIFAGLSFFVGSQNARSHLMMGIIGAIVGFGAPSIINLISSLIH